MQVAHLLGPLTYPVSHHIVVEMCQLSKASKRDTIRGVQTRAGAIYVWWYRCAIIVAHVTYM